MPLSMLAQKIKPAVRYGEILFVSFLDEKSDFQLFGWFMFLYFLCRLELCCKWKLYPINRNIFKSTCFDIFFWWK